MATNTTKSVFKDSKVSEAELSEKATTVKESETKINHNLKENIGEIDKTPVKLSPFIKNETTIGFTDGYEGNYTGVGVKINLEKGNFTPMLAFKQSPNAEYSLFFEGNYSSPNLGSSPFNVTSRTRLFANNVNVPNNTIFSAQERICLATSCDLGKGFSVYGSTGISINYKQNEGVSCSPALFGGINKNFKLSQGAQGNVYTEYFPLDKAVVFGLKFTL